MSKEYSELKTMKRSIKISIIAFIVSLALTILTFYIMELIK